MRAAEAIALAAVVVLGLSAGAQLTEAVVFVGYWRSLPTEEFLAWFGKNEPRLVAFYGPLQVSALIVTALATLAHALQRRQGLGPLIVAVASSMVVLALYGIYFEDVNASFVARSIDVSEVPAELERWAAWQWLRTAVGTAAFVAGIVAVRRSEAALASRGCRGGTT